MKSRLLGAVCAVLFTTVMNATADAAAMYRVTDLGTLGGTQSAAYDINDFGVIVGEAFVAGDTTAYAVAWDSSIITNLGTLSGGGYSRAYGINNLGQVVGYSDSTVTGQHSQRAFSWNGSLMSDLGTLGGRWSEAAATNDSGSIVGFSEVTVSSGFYATLWDSSGTTNIASDVGIQSSGHDVSETGKIVGFTDGFGDRRGYIWENGTVTLINTLGGNSSSANAINENNVVVGWGHTSDGQKHALLWDGLNSSDLGTLGGIESDAYDINEAGLTVGYSFSNDGAKHATIWDSDGIADLNNLIDSAAGWELVEAYGINNSGAIVGRGSINGEMHAFLATVVPIPPALYLFGSGLIGLIGVARRKAT